MLKSKAKLLVEEQVVLKSTLLWMGNRTKFTPNLVDKAKLVKIILEPSFKELNKLLDELLRL